MDLNIAVAKAIAKHGLPQKNGTTQRIIFCTGLKFEEEMRDGLGATLQQFCPEHTNKLSNPTRCYTTFPCALLNET